MELVEIDDRAASPLYRTVSINERIAQKKGEERRGVWRGNVARSCVLERIFDRFLRRFSLRCADFLQRFGAICTVVVAPRIQLIRDDVIGTRRYRK